MNEFKGKVIVITGASAGIGRAIAQELARKGASLGLIARGKVKLESAGDEARGLGARVHTISVDVSHEQELERAAREIEEQLGPIDVWINNAMVTSLGKVMDLSSDEFRHIMDVNYLGSVNGSRVALRRFRARNQGHLIQIGSALAYVSIPLQSAYCASKHAVHGFIQSLRIELKMDASKVNLTEVQLPAVNTPQFEWMKNYMPEHPQPVPPIFEPEVVARAVTHVIRRPRREMWVGGPTVKSILGGRLAPRIAEWKLTKMGVKSQQSKLIPPTGEDNLFRPVTEDYGAHGIFGSVAKKWSIQNWLNINRRRLGAAGTFVVLSVLGLLGLGKSGQNRRRAH